MGLFDNTGKQHISFFRQKIGAHIPHIQLCKIVDCQFGEGTLCARFSIYGDSVCEFGYTINRKNDSVVNIAFMALVEPVYTGCFG